DNVVTADANRTLVGGKITGHHFHGGRFARAVGAQEPQNLARLYGKAQTRHGRTRSETLGEVLNFDHSLGNRFFSVWKNRTGAASGPLVTVRRGVLRGQSENSAPRHCRRRDVRTSAGCGGALSP